MIHSMYSVAMVALVGASGCAMMDDWALGSHGDDSAEQKSAPEQADKAAAPNGDRIYGETTMEVPAIYYVEKVIEDWDNLLCIAPSGKLSDARCAELEPFEWDTSGPEPEDWTVRLRYEKFLGDGAFTGMYSNRGLTHGMWFGNPCNGGYIKAFFYPNPPNIVFHEEDITALPDGSNPVC